MRIQYCSDLHLEFPENAAFLQEVNWSTQADILIIAGDLVPFSQMEKHLILIEKLCKPYRQVYWIPGNHEYYYDDHLLSKGSLFKHILPNLTLVNNQSIEIENVEFIFSTLWTHIQPDKEYIIEQRLSDFYLIQYNHKPFTSFIYNELHKQSIEFIHHALENSQDKTRIVVTHHCPTLKNYPSKYKNSPINQAFAVELEKFITAHQPEYWIYGHTHMNTKAFKIGVTHLLTNQLGYVRHFEHKSFKPDSLIEI